MTLQDLGSIGEFVGAIAVVISLVYLALQVRRNTQQLASNQQALLRTESSSAHAQWSAFRHMLINNPDARAVWHRGQADYDGLGEEEKDQFYWIATDFFYVIHNMRERHLAGTIHAGLWERNRRRARTFIESPGGSKWWSRNKQVFVDDLVDEVEGDDG